MPENVLQKNGSASDSDWQQNLNDEETDEYEYDDEEDDEIKEEPKKEQGIAKTVHSFN